MVCVSDRLIKASSAPATPNPSGAIIIKYLAYYFAIYRRVSCIFFFFKEFSWCGEVFFCNKSCITRDVIRFLTYRPEILFFLRFGPGIEPVGLHKVHMVLIPVDQHKIFYPVWNNLNYFFFWYRLNSIFFLSKAHQLRTEVFLEARPWMGERNEQRKENSESKKLKVRIVDMMSCLFLATPLGTPWTSPYTPP